MCGRVLANYYCCCYYYYYYYQEFVDCRRVTLKVNPQEPLPTLTAERCHDFQLYFYEPTAMESIYTVYCSGFKVFFQEPHQKENSLDVPTDDFQYVTKYHDKKFKTSRVLRGEELKKVMSQVE